MPLSETMHASHEGIASSWPTRAKTIEALRSVGDSAVSDDAIRAYNARTDHKNEIKVVQSFDYGAIGYRLQALAIAKALEGSGGWEVQLGKSVQYQLFSHRMDYFWHEQFRILFPKHPRPLGMLAWEHMTNAMVFAFLLGWHDLAIYQGTLIHAVLNRGFQLRGSYQIEHRRAHALILRLYANWRGDGTAHAWPDWAMEVPTYEAILQDWRGDVERIGKLLLAACDRHTHESKYDTATKFFDFGDGLYTHTPIEILFVLKLRNLMKLPIPELDHPLLAAPFDRLPTALAPIEPDDLMVGTQRRAERDWPNFRVVTAFDSVKKWAKSAA